MKKTRKFIAKIEVINFLKDHTLDEAANHFKISRMTIWKFAKKEGLALKKPGRRQIIR